jgi:hypothetical protein
VDRRIGPGLLAELADVPDGDVDRLVELRRRDLRRLDALAQRQQARRDIRGNVSVMHAIPALRLLSQW